MPRFASPTPPVGLGEVDPQWPNLDQPAHPSPDPSNGSHPTLEDRIEDGRRSVGADPDRPTDTSSAGSTSGRLRPGGDPENTAKALTGLLLVFTLGLAWVARKRGWEFRSPTQEEASDMMTPVARIAVRRLPMDLLNPDIYDFAEAVSAFDSYAKADVLLSRSVPDAGHGLEEVPQ
jgi:hypothetical protein